MNPASGIDTRFSHHALTDGLGLRARGPLMLRFEGLLSTYIFDQAWERERERLNGLAVLYDEGTERVLSAAGVARGWRCLEIGGGTGTIARWLASQVGPQGQVVVTDVDVRFLDELDDERVKVRRHDIVRDDLEEGAFDLVHARLVIQHLSARECALQKAARALRRGGVLVVEDAIVCETPCNPDFPAWHRVMRAFVAAFQTAGADPIHGVRLPAMLADIGLQDIHCEARMPIAFSATSTSTFLSLSLAQARDQFVAAGLLTATEVDATLEMLAQPGYAATAPTVVACWGTRR